MSESETENVSRRERRAKAKGAATEEVKDRNQRLRSSAAARRRDRQRELEAATRQGLDTGERIDDVLTRTADATGRFMRSNFKWLQWVIVAGVAGALAFMVYDYRQDLQREKNGTSLAAALDAVYGRLSSDEPAQPADRSLVDTREEFSTADERIKAANSAWKKLAAAKKSPELTLMARLGEASVLYDERKFAEARGVYEQVVSDPTSARFPHLKARAQEGIGLAYEAENKSEDALKAFSTLKDMGRDSEELGTFHVARVKYTQGETSEAQGALERLLEKLSARRAATDRPGYLEAATEDLLKTVDPARAAKPQGMDPAQLEALRRQLEQLQRGAGNMPALPAPTPAESGDSSATEESAPAPEPQPSEEPAQAADKAPSAKSEPASPSPSSPAASQPPPAPVLAPKTAAPAPQKQAEPSPQGSPPKAKAPMEPEAPAPQAPAPVAPAPAPADPAPQGSAAE